MVGKLLPFYILYSGYYGDVRNNNSDIKPVEMIEDGGVDPHILASSSDLYQYPSRT